MNTDWIEWNGGECPVALETLVDVKYRGKTTWKGAKAKEFRWNHLNHVSDIIAYRVASNISPVMPSSTTTTSPQKTESQPETRSRTIELDNAISDAIQTALRNGVSVDGITAVLTEIKSELEKARFYIDAAQWRGE